MYLRRIVISSSLFPAIRLTIENSIGSGGAMVVIGPNGSGKTVLAKALRAALSKDGGPWRTDLADMGVQQVEIDFAVQQWFGHLSYTLPEGRREIQWEKQNQESSAWLRAQGANKPVFSKSGGSLEPPDLVLPDLLPSVHMACAGQLDVYPDEQLLSSIVQTVCAPLERELAGWQAREAHLCGGDSGGRLGAARAELMQAEANLSSVEEAHHRLEEARAQRAQMEARVSQLRSQTDVLSQEIVVQEKLASHAQRAALLDEWITEIAAESTDLRQLRHRHVDIQTQFDALDERYRGITDDVLLHAGEYLELGRVERELTQRIKELQERREEASAGLNQVRSELAALSESPTHLQHQIQALREEQDRINGELDVTLRARIELLRRREGLAERLQSEFPSFVVCDEAALAALERWLTGENPVRRKPDEVALSERQRHLEEVRASLAERFAGFERVLATTDTVREYHEMQRSASLLSADLESLHRRVAVVERKIHPLRAAVVAVLAAVGAFALGTTFLGWDIAVFVAVCVSGIALLGMRWAMRRDEAILKTSRTAVATLDRKLQDIRANVEKMARSLGPLATLDAGSATARLTEYRRLCDLRDMLDQELREEHAQTDAEETTPLQLPADLRMLDRQLLARRYADFRSLREETNRLDGAWRAYENDGTEHRRIGELERQLVELRQRLEAIYAELSQQDANREAERQRLERQIAEYETAQAGSEAEQGVREELTLLHKKRAELAAAIGGDMTEERLVELQHGESMRGELQTQLREIRDQLSHRQHPEDLAAREAILRDEAVAVRQKVQTLDPLYLLVGTVADYAAKYAAQLRTLRQDLEQTTSSLNDVQRELQGMSVDSLENSVALERPLDELQQSVSEGRRKVEDVERDLMTTRELIASLQAELADAGPTVRADLFAEISRQLQSLSAQRLVALSAKNGVWMVEQADGAARPLNSLSDGTRDLVFLAIRVGILESIKKADANPVVWDEVFARQDERSLDAIRDHVNRLSASRQVILLSRQLQMETWGHLISLGSEFSPESVRGHD